MDALVRQLKGTMQDLEKIECKSFKMHNNLLPYRITAMALIAWTIPGLWFKHKRDMRATPKRLL